MEDMISLNELKTMPEQDYMNDKQLSFFQRLLETLRISTVMEIDECRSDITQANREPDLVDIASNEDERTRRLRFVDRKVKFLKKIDQSLDRIRKKDYGYCDETGKEIGIERLLLRPTATLSVEAKRMQEEREIHYRED